MDLIAPSKDTSWQNGLKRKIEESATYKRPTSSQKQALAESERLEDCLLRQCPP
jgi:hypothetical protein